MRKLLLLLVFAGMLYYLNPTMRDFEVFLEEEADTILTEEIGGGDLGRAIAGLGSNLLGSITDDITERQDFLVCSLYTIDLDRSADNDDQWQFLGIGGQFIQLKAPDQDRRREP